MKVEQWTMLVGNLFMFEAARIFIGKNVKNTHSLDLYSFLSPPWRRDVTKTLSKEGSIYPNKMGDLFLIYSRHWQPRGYVPETIKTFCLNIKPLVFV